MAKLSQAEEKYFAREAERISTRGSLAEQKYWAREIGFTGTTTFGGKVQTFVGGEQITPTSPTTLIDNRYKPIYSAGQLKGYEDVVAGKSIGIQEFNKIQMQTPAQKLQAVLTPQYKTEAQKQLLTSVLPEGTYYKIEKEKPQQLKPIPFKEIDWGKTFFPVSEMKQYELGIKEKPTFQDWIESKYQQADIWLRQRDIALAKRLGMTAPLSEKTRLSSITAMGKFIAFAPLMQTGATKQITKTVKVKETEKGIVYVRNFEKMWEKEGTSKVIEQLKKISDIIKKETDPIKKEIGIQNLKYLLDELKSKNIIPTYVLNEKTGTLSIPIEPSGTWVITKAPRMEKIGEISSGVRIVTGEPTTRPSLFVGKGLYERNEQTERLHKLFSSSIPQKTIQEQEQKQKLTQALMSYQISQQREQQKQEQKLNQMLSLGLAVKTETALKLKTAQKQQENLKRIFETPGIDFKKPKKIPEYPIDFDFKLKYPEDKKQIKAYKIKTQKLRTAYQPSLGAILLGYSASEKYIKQLQKGLTGLELRPMYPKTKKQDYARNYAKQLNKIFGG